MTEDELSAICGVAVADIRALGAALGVKTGPWQPRQYDFADVAVLLTYNLIELLISAYIGKADRGRSSARMLDRIRAVFEEREVKRWLIIGPDGWQTMRVVHATQHSPGCIIVDLHGVSTAIRQIEEQLGYPLGLFADDLESSG